MNAVNRCISILAVAASAIAVTGCGQSQYSSPEQTLSTAKDAAMRHDYLALARCLSPDARDQTAASLVLLGSFITAGSNAPGPAAEQAKIRKEKLDAVYKKHGITAETLPKINLSFGATQEQQAKEIVKLAQPIKDREAFIADFFALMNEIGDQGGKKLFTDDARVDDLKIDGDTATATFVQTRDGKTKSSPIAFKRLHGNWKIDKVPQLFN